MFLKYGLMENGTIWGHGAYLGPDFSAEYLHTLTLDTREATARQVYQRGWSSLAPAEQAAVNAQVRQALKENRYDPATDVRTFTQAESASYKGQIQKWADYFTAPTGNAYTFLLWAGDGTPDTFHIRIWWEVDGVENVVYDEGFNQTISGGSIVVHRGK